MTATNYFKSLKRYKRLIPPQKENILMSTSAQRQGNGILSVNQTRVAYEIEKQDNYENKGKSQKWLQRVPINIASE